MPRRLMLTVDVEAQLRRAVDNHVDRLIWGKFPEGEAGIGKMMDIADKYGAKLTMFLDWSESDIHGDAVKDVGREIDRRGHDLQLHVHTDFFGPEFWSRNNINPELDLNILTQEQADVIADEICERQVNATGTAPLAFRGGGYRWSEKLLDALARNGVALDSSINISRPTQPVDFSMSRQFRWSNGMIEVPVSNVAKYRNRPYPLDFNFNTSYFPDAGSMYEYLDAFWQERGDDAIAVLVLHSWSLLKLGPDGIFRYDGEHNARRFAKFLKGLRRRVEIVTTKDVLELDKKNALVLDPAVDLAFFGEAQQRKQEGSRSPHIPYTAPASVLKGAGYTSLSCPICGAAKDRFVKMNGRQCPDCGSVERQRSFAVAYDKEIWQRFSLTGRNVLIFSPSASELRFMKDRGLASKRSADIRPEVKPDIALDMCAMPEIESGSQDFVFASYLMPVVYDMKAALDEVERVLAPGGAFVSVEPLKEGVPTREISDSDTQSAWYGKETLEKYKVGSYRILGEADYLAELDRHFTVERFTARDPITGQINHIHLCWSKNGATNAGARRPTCTICGALVPVSNGPANCPECLSRPRTRTLPEVLVRFVAGHRDGAPLDSILMFNPSGAETRATAFRFATCQSASLHGYYGSGHLEGVDIAQMPEIASESYSAVSGIGVLEFSSDMEAAIHECFRVLKPGGMFFTLFSGDLLLSNSSAPGAKGTPVSLGHGSDAREQPHAVGREWLLRTLSAAGFEASHEPITDPVTGEVFDWFVGHKRTRNKTTLSNLPQLSDVAKPKKEVPSKDEIFKSAEELWKDTSSRDSQVRSVELFQNLYDLGDRARAGYRLGAAYYYGRGVQRDLENAYAYLSIKELDSTRFALYFRGLILNSPEFSSFDEKQALVVLRQAHELGVDAAAPHIEALQKRFVCPICEALPNGEEEACPSCGSLKSHRIFMDAYQKSLHYCYDISGKRGIAVGPTNNEFISKLNCLQLEEFKDGNSPIEEYTSEYFEFCIIFTDKSTDKISEGFVNGIQKYIKSGGIIYLSPSADFNLDALDEFKIQKTIAFDPFTGDHEFVFSCQKLTSNYLKKKKKCRTAYISKIIEENKKNELDSGCAFSARYRSYKETHPGVSYAEFAVSLEADIISSHAAHATLGLNISDGSFRQGEATYIMYRDLLSVEKDNRVIEYGCGSLRVGAGFINYLNAGRFCGVDVVRTFYDLGCQRTGPETIAAKDVRFYSFDASGIGDASDFGADHVYASAVFFHIHPDDVEDGIRNLRNLAGKPGAKLIFDAKVTRGSQPKRYPQKDGKGGWAWPLDFYREAFAPLDLVAVHGRTRYDYWPEVDFAHLEFRMPHISHRLNDQFSI